MPAGNPSRRQKRRLEKLLNHLAIASLGRRIKRLIYKLL